MVVVVTVLTMKFYLYFALAPLSYSDAMIILSDINDSNPMPAQWDSRVTNVNSPVMNISEETDGYEVATIVIYGYLKWV